MSYLEKAYEEDIRIRKEEGTPSPQGVAIVAKDFDEGVVYEENGVRVTAFKVKHGEVIEEAYGFRVDYKGRSLVISGDTGPTENFVKYAQGADVVIHEVGVAITIPEIISRTRTTYAGPLEAGEDLMSISIGETLLFSGIHIS